MTTISFAPDDKTELEKANLFISLAFSMFPYASMEYDNDGQIIVCLGVYEDKKV
jgi:hypothetical protein